MAQVFVESVFEKHVDWITPIKNDDNYKHSSSENTQRIQSHTDYLEIEEHDVDNVTIRSLFKIRSTTSRCKTTDALLSHLLNHITTYI